jgi:hypothetical protein
LNPNTFHTRVKAQRPQWLRNRNRCARARAAPGRKQRGNKLKKHTFYTQVYALSQNGKRCARARRAWPEKARKRLKNMQFKLVSRVWGRSGRGMASAVHARRAWPVAARERLEKTYSLRSCLESGTRGGRQMTIAVRARRAWLEAARERFEYAFILNSCLGSGTAMAAKRQALCARATPGQKQRGKDLKRHTF